MSPHGGIQVIARAVVPSGGTLRPGITVRVGPAFIPLTGRTIGGRDTVEERTQELPSLYIDG